MRTILALLILAVTSFGAELKIDGETTVKPYRLVRLKAVGADAKTGILWRVRPENPANAVDWGSKRNAANLEFVAPPGRYTVELLVGKTASGGVLELDAVETVVTIGDPGPGPGPSPGPTPGPSPAPIPLEGFRVLMIYQDSEQNKYTPGQRGAIYGQAVRDYLDSKCVSVNGTREYRIWDKDADPTGAAKHWQDAFNRPRTALPWLIASNGKAGYEGPIPANLDETLKILKKVGGE